MKKWIATVLTAGALALGYLVGSAAVADEACAQCKRAGEPCQSSAECCGTCVFTNDSGQGVCHGGG
ncbi:MAG TPA: hypothetical protein VIL20_13850 [Sandaracinaceae bacterium]